MYNLDILEISCYKAGLYSMSELIYVLLRLSLEYNAINVRVS